MDCLSNLPKCKASCCKLIAFVSEGDEATAHYWRVHGLTVVPHPVNDRLFIVTVPQTCPKLDVETSMCTIHGTDEYPEACNRLDWGKTEDFVITEGCLLEPTKHEETPNKIGNYGRHT